MFKSQHSKRARSIRDVEARPVVSDVNPFASKVALLLAVLFSVSLVICACEKGKKKGKSVLVIICLCVDSYWVYNTCWRAPWVRTMCAFSEPCIKTLLFHVLQMLACAYLVAHAKNLAHSSTSTF
jgi:hypothetical protein